MNQLSMSFDPAPNRHASTGAELKRRGQKQAIDKAGSDWIQSTLTLLQQYLAEHKACGARDFTIEDFRAYCTLKHRPLPPSSNAWGAVPRVAVGAKLIEWTGRYTNATSPKTRAHPVRVWRAL